MSQRRPARTAHCGYRSVLTEAQEARRAGRNVVNRRRKGLRSDGDSPPARSTSVCLQIHLCRSTARPDEDLWLESVTARKLPVASYQRRTTNEVPLLGVRRRACHRLLTGW